MRKTISPILSLLLSALVLTLASSCENDEEFVRILTGKTWKMSRLTENGSSSQFYLTWDTEEEYETSMSYFTVSSYYVITFEGVEYDGELVGNEVTLRGVNRSATGTWTASGENHAMSLDLTFSGAGDETDPLAIAFINGIQNVYRYEGDENNLNLFFKDDGETYVIGFVPR